MLGVAVDVTGADGKRLEWMFNNIEKFGFSWEVVPSATELSLLNQEEED